MKTFLAIYLGTPEAMSKWQELPESVRAERQAAGMLAWNEWGECYKDMIVDHGAPLGRTKSASSRGISDVRNKLTGYAILRAESHEEAAKLFENHPHFTIFPGDSVEVMECLPIPSD
jgi:hypothetical protein